MLNIQLIQSVANIDIPAWAEKASVLAILFMLVIYFSKQLEKMQELRELDRKSFDEKRENDEKELRALIEKVLTALNNNTNALNTIALKK